MSRSLRGVIDAIPDTAWTSIPYSLDDGAAVAETTYRAFNNKHGALDCRLIVRRVRPTPGSQLALFTTWSYHAFITNRTGPTVALEADHRRHAVVENTIGDLKHGVGLNHLPSGRFGANAAWLGLNVIAHNLAGFTARLGGLDTPGPAQADSSTTEPPDAEPPDADTPTELALRRATFVATDTLRRQHLRVPGRITRSARRSTLHLPHHWPRGEAFRPHPRQAPRRQPRHLTDTAPGAPATTGRGRRRPLLPGWRESSRPLSAPLKHAEPILADTPNCTVPSATGTPDCTDAVDPG